MLQHQQNKQNFKKTALALVLASSLFSSTIYADDSTSTAEPITADSNYSAQMQALDWHKGPATETILSKGTVKLEKDQGFLDASNTEKFLQLTGNIPTPNENVLYSMDKGWWADFSFDASGYVKDDEKIDADEILKNIKAGDEPSNEERKRLGMAALYTDGWYMPPHYDKQTNHLEWAVKLSSEGQTFVNYTVRLLGRSGVMSATLVTSPDTLDKDVKEFKQTLSTFDFVDGERYSQFKEGDKVAAYGLAALVAGGAAAIATKKGFWALLAGFFAAAWKFIAVAAVGAFTWLGSLFKKNK